MTRSGTGRPSVLFVCIHNAGRSQTAAGWLTALTVNVERLIAELLPDQRPHPARGDR